MKVNNEKKIYGTRGKMKEEEARKEKEMRRIRKSRQ